MIFFEINKQTKRKYVHMSISMYFISIYLFICIIYVGGVDYDKQIKNIYN